jgi:hypothetical protein
MRLTIAFGFLVLLGPALRADDAPAGSPAAAIAPYVDDQTYVVAHVDVSRVNIDMLAKQMQKLGMDPGEATRG